MESHSPHVLIPFAIWNWCSVLLLKLGRVESLWMKGCKIMKCFTSSLLFLLNHNPLEETTEE